MGNMLFDFILHTPTGKQQTKKILEAVCNGVNTIPEVHGTDRKNHLTKLRDGAVVDAIHTGPADDRGISGSAVVGNIGIALLQTNSRVPDVQFLKFLISGHWWPP